MVAANAQKAVDATESKSMSLRDITQTMDGQKSREATEHLFSPKKLAGMLVGKTHDEASEIFQNMGIEKETANTMATAALMGGAAVTVASATEVSQRALNYAKGSYIANEGFSYQAGTITDEDGKEKAVMKEVKKGQSVNINSSPELKEYFENNKNDFSLEKGINLTKIF